MVLSLLFGGTAQAGLTVGVGIGGLMDLPGGPFDDGCGGSGDTSQAPYPEYLVDGEPNYVEGDVASACSRKIRFGGQLVVPVRIHLGELAAVKIVPGAQAAAYNGSISWAQDGKDYTYQGHTAFVVRPNLAIGGELAFSPKGITPYVGASVSAGFAYDIHSLGLNANGEHGETMGAYDLRTTDHCNQVGGEERSGSGECNLDAVRTDFTVGGELALGVRTAGADKPGFFVEGVYNAFTVRAKQPKDYPDSVQLGAAKINPLGITAGLLIPL